MMNTRTKYRLHRSIGYQLSVATRLQERRLDEKLKNLGLTRTTWCVLLAVGNELLIHPSDIADFVGIDRTATSRALRQMEAENLIEREAGAGDRRMTAVKLTKAGAERLEQGTPYAISSNAVIEASLNEHDLSELRRILSKLRNIDTQPLNRL